jgi:hypothetical protein
MPGVLRREQQRKAAGWGDELLLLALALALALLSRLGVGRCGATGRWWWMVVAAPIVASWRSLGKERQRPPVSALRASILSVCLFFFFAFLFSWERHKTSPTEMGADRSAFHRVSKRMAKPIRGIFH